MNREEILNLSEEIKTKYGELVNSILDKNDDVIRTLNSFEESNSSDYIQIQKDIEDKSIQFTNLLIMSKLKLNDIIDCSTDYYLNLLVRENHIKTLKNGKQ